MISILLIGVNFVFAWRRRRFSLLLSSRTDDNEGRAAASPSPSPIWRGHNPKPQPRPFPESSASVLWGRDPIWLPRIRGPTYGGNACPSYKWRESWSSSWTTTERTKEFSTSDTCVLHTFIDHFWGKRINKLVIEFSWWIWIPVHCVIPALAPSSMYRVVQGTSWSLSLLHSLKHFPCAVPRIEKYTLTAWHLKEMCLYFDSSWENNSFIVHCVPKITSLFQILLCRCAEISIITAAVLFLLKIPVLNQYETFRLLKFKWFEWTKLYFKVCSPCCALLITSDLLWAVVRWKASCESEFQSFWSFQNCFTLEPTYIAHK